MVAPALTDIAASEGDTRYIDRMGRNTYSANLFGLCATTTPIHALGSPLPVGLQVMCPPRQESKALAIARMLEDIVGVPPRPDLSGFA